jgi:hypothetical protein
MRTFRKRLGQKFGTRKLRHNKLRAKKPKTRRQGRGLSPQGMELKTYTTNQSSEECKRLQNELNKKDQEFMNYSKAMKKYVGDYDKWYNENLEKAYYGQLDWSMQPSRPQEPSRISKELVNKVRLACGKHFVQNI